MRGLPNILQSALMRLALQPRRGDALNFALPLTEGPGYVPTRVQSLRCVRGVSCRATDASSSSSTALSGRVALRKHTSRTRLKKRARKAHDSLAPLKPPGERRRWGPYPATGVEKSLFTKTKAPPPSYPAACTTARRRGKSKTRTRRTCGCRPSQERPLLA